MPNLDSNEELEGIDSEVFAACEYVMKADPALREYSKTSPAHFVRIIERVVEYTSQDKQAAIREARIDGWQRTIQTLKIVHDEEYVYGHSSMKSARHWMKQAEKQLASLNQPTKEGE